MLNARGVRQLTAVLLARVGPNVAPHRVLLDAVTACGSVIGPSWDKYRGPLESVTCPVCRERSDVPRDGQPATAVPPRQGL